MALLLMLFLTLAPASASTIAKLERQLRSLPAGKAPVNRVISLVMRLSALDPDNSSKYVRIAATKFPRKTSIQLSRNLSDQLADSLETTASTSSTPNIRREVIATLRNSGNNSTSNASLSITGSGTLTLTGTSSFQSFNRNTTVNSGSLNLTTNTNIVSGNAVVISPSGYFPGSTGSTISLESLSTYGVIHLSAGNWTLVDVGTLILPQGTIFALDITSTADLENFAIVVQNAGGTFIPLTPPEVNSDSDTADSDSSDSESDY